MSGSTTRSPATGTRLERRRAVLRTVQRRQALDRRRRVVALRTAGLLRSAADHAADQLHRE